MLSSRFVWEILTHQEMAPRWISTKNIHAKDKKYTYIEDGTWLDDSPYGVVHHIASDGSVKGVGSTCIEWAYQQCGHLRIDTHGDNAVMQRLLEKLGFKHCGTIYIEEDDYPRLAFERV